MAIGDNIRDGKLQYDTNRVAAQVSALSSGKIDKYKYLAGEEILASNRRKIIEQVKFAHSPLGEALKSKSLNPSNKK